MLLFLYFHHLFLHDGKIISQQSDSSKRVALSFIRKGSDLVMARKLLGEHAKKIMLVSKVENQEEVVNFDDILANSDAFMVARGDLGMEIPIKICLAQKAMIFKCNASGKHISLV